MATYLDGMKGGKHNSDSTEVSFNPRTKKKVKKQPKKDKK